MSYTLESLSNSRDVMVLQKVDNPVSLDLLDKQIDLGVILDQASVEMQLGMEEFEKTRNALIPELQSCETVTKAMEGINEGQTKRKLVMIVKDSDIPGYEGHKEADFKIAEMQNGELRYLDTNTCGFIVAKTPEELTLNDELKKAADFLEKRYLSQLPEARFKPETYRFGFLAKNMRKKGDKDIATIVLKLFKYRANKEYGTVQEYWQNIVKPLVLSDKYSLAAKTIIVAEFARDMARVLSKQYVDETAYRKAINVLSRMQDMFDRAWKNPEKYSITKKEQLHKIKQFGKDVPKNIKTMIAKNLFENMFLNTQVIGDLYNREIQGKLLRTNTKEFGLHGSLEKQQPYYAEVTCEVIYEEK